VAALAVLMPTAEDLTHQQIGMCAKIGIGLQLALLG